MKHISLVWFVFSSLAISAFTTEMQTSPCLGREMKPPAHAGGTAANPGSQNPTPKNRNFRVQFWKPGHPCKCLSILQDFIPLLFCSGISSQLLCVFWDFFGLSDKNNNNKPNEPSKERAWTFSWRRQWLFLDFACQLPLVSEMNSPSFCSPETHHICLWRAANHIHLPGWLHFLMKDAASELKVEWEGSPAVFSKNLL